jgi:molecular chaperone DnaJ
VAPQREWLEKDYYEVLGVAKDASQDAIKKAYRKLARANHPDANPGDPEAEARFKAVGEAYAVLGDEQQRREYDELRRLGAAGFATGGPGGFGGFGPGGFEGADLGDLLGSLFGSAAGRRLPGRDRHPDTARTAGAGPARRRAPHLRGRARRRPDHAPGDR